MNDAEQTKGTVVITGAAGNLGRAVVAQLKDTYRLVLVDVSDDALSSIEAPDNTLRMAVDLMSPASAKVAMQDAQEKAGPLYGLVTTVGGFGGGAPLHEAPEGQLEKLLKLNVQVTGNITAAIAPHLIASKRGRIVTIGSLGSLAADPNFVAYSVAKTAVLRLTEGLSAELSQHGISANCILPSTLDTPTNRKAMPDADPSKWVQPAAIAKVIAFLLSDDATPVNGSAVRLPGGS